MARNWRDLVRQHYEAKIFSADAPKAFTWSDTPSMKGDILSRGDDRSGIDYSTGRERITSEIDWAGSTDGEIVAEAAVLIPKRRPPGIGRANVEYHK